MKFRDLRADEVDARISTVSEKGISLLLYKDARCDMRILDEIVGSENWQREHYECKGNLFCRVGIKMPDWNDWVWKSDCGTESYFFPDKRRHDADNYCGKLLLDGLTKAGAIKDDDFSHVALVVYGHVDKADPRTEITVTRMWAE